MALLAVSEILVKAIDRIHNHDLTRRHLFLMRTESLNRILFRNDALAYVLAYLQIRARVDQNLDASTHIQQMSSISVLPSDDLTIPLVDYLLVCNHYGPECKELLGRFLLANKEDECLQRAAFAECQAIARLAKLNIHGDLFEKYKRELMEKVEWLRAEDSVIIKVLT